MSDYLTDLRRRSGISAGRSTKLTIVESEGGEVAVRFINRGYNDRSAGLTKVKMIQMGLGRNQQPVMYVASPNFGDKLVAEWDAQNGEWVVDMD